MYDEGRLVLNLIAKGGIFIIAPTVPTSDIVEESVDLMNYASTIGLICARDTNSYGFPYYIFERKN